MISDRKTAHSRSGFCVPDVSAFPEAHITFTSPQQCPGWARYGEVEEGGMNRFTASLVTTEPDCLVERLRRLSHSSAVPGVIDALAGAHHVLEMFRRTYQTALPARASTDSPTDSPKSPPS